MSPRRVPVTRIELLDFVAEAFDRLPTTRGEMLVVATRNGARRAVLRELGRLPEVPVWGPEQLWAHLGDVPVAVSEAGVSGSGRTPGACPS